MAEPKKLTELQEVQQRAIYQVKKRIREQEEEEAFKAALNSGNPLPGQGGNFPDDTSTDEKKGK